MLSIGIIVNYRMNEDCTILTDKGRKALFSCPEKYGLFIRIYARQDK